MALLNNYIPGNHIKNVYVMIKLEKMLKRSKFN